MSCESGCSQANQGSRVRSEEMIRRPDGADGFFVADAFRIHQRLVQDKQRAPDFFQSFSGHIGHYLKQGRCFSL